jgi:hypothetical protein
MNPSEIEIDGFSTVITEMNAWIKEYYNKIFEANEE